MIAMDPIGASMKIAASALEGQSVRMRVVSENLANAQATGKTPGAAPYQRKTVTFASELDAAIGVNRLTVSQIGRDTTPFRIEHRPGHPAADPRGYVRMPNVNVITEMADMRETARAYEANLQIIKHVRAMTSATLDLLRS